MRPLRTFALIAPLALGTTAARNPRPPGPVTAARQPHERPNPFAMHRVEIAPNVHGFFETGINAIVSSNIVAVIGTRDVLVFDSGHHPLDTRAIVDSIKALTDKPVRYLVVSHWHDDHWVGNAEFARAWPGVEVIAHPFTARLMQTRKEAFRGAPCRAELADGEKEMRETLARGTRADGTPIPEASRARVQRFLDGFEAERDQCDARVFRGVDRELADSLTLDLGGRQVQLRFLGRGNTAGDLVAILPAERIVMTGDLVVSPFPFATQSYISEWSKVLRAVERMTPRTIVPGHGEVEHDPSYLRLVAETLESIERQARAAYRPGMPVDSLRARIDLSLLAARFTHGDPFLEANFNYMMKSLAVQRMWEELEGRLKPEGI